MDSEFERFGFDFLNISREKNQKVTTEYDNGNSNVSD
jgi:hypothetical protein